MKVADMTGAELDHWVARAEQKNGGEWYQEGDCVTWVRKGDASVFRPSTNWGCGGPIIEREKIFLFQHWRSLGNDWSAWIGAGWAGGYELSGADHQAEGPTPLIAAMRAYVASVYGDTVPDQDGSQQLPGGTKEGG